MSSRYDEIYGREFDPSVRRMYDVLSEKHEGQGVFAIGVYAVREQGDLAERPLSISEEALQRYEMWLESVRSGDLAVSPGDDQNPTVLLGMFAEVSVRREAGAMEESREVELSRSHGGSI